MVRRSGRSWLAIRQIDVFVELMGGDRAIRPRARSRLRSPPASRWSRANKALLAKHGVKLAQLAEKAGVALNYEAAVGAAPSRSSRPCAKAWPAIRFNRIYGILNGTCNYILTRMEQEKAVFADCLKEAQRLGYAEADPTFDIEGHDTAQKLAIVASLAFGIKVDARAPSMSKAFPSIDAGRSRSRR